MKELKESKLLIVDDERELLRMVEGMLRKEGFSRIFAATSCEEARHLFYRESPDCAILDIMLPDGDGFELLRLFRETSELPVLFLSARDENEDRLLGLGLGADDYIIKPFLPRELTLRLMAILKRVYLPHSKQKSSKPIFQLGKYEVDLNSGQVNSSDTSALLTAKEYALLEKLYENRGNIVTLDGLCRAAWGDSSYGYENTLMVHIRRIREKIEENPSQPCFLLTMRGLGYKLVIGDER